MPLPKINVSQLTLYNPARMKDVEIIAAFVARKSVFERIIADLAGEKANGRGQHHLIVGQRGMGKSTLLARLAAELRTDAELCKRFVPLVFAEEQYAVDRMSKFWLNCLDSLADAAERAGDIAASDQIDATVRDLKPLTGGTGEKDQTPARAALGAFLKAAKKGGKRPVLLVDNLQLVFERIAAIEQHALRELLMQPGSPILIGGSPTPPPESQDYGAAFYDHFKIHYLRPLSADEMRDLMLALAEMTGRTDVRDRVLAYPQRLQTLRDLTGGNPRTVVILFFLYAEDFSPSVFADLQNLLDRVTPLYKARIEELPEQQQVVVSAVADHWAPVTARVLSEATGLPSSTITAQLDRLEHTGFVEKVEIFGQSSAGFQIAERFFNVWFLMRSASRRQRREIEFLVRFIESFYDAKDRPRLAHDLIKEERFSPDRMQFAKALACTLESDEKEELDRHTELAALREEEAEARRKLEEVIDFSKLSPVSLAFNDLKLKLMALVPADAGVTPEAFAKEVLGDRQMFMNEERERLAASEGKLSKEKIGVIRKSIAAATRRDIREYGKTAALWLRDRLITGQLPSLEGMADWKRSFQKADKRKSIQVLVDTIPFRVGSRLGDEVQSKIRRLLRPQFDRNAWDWYMWGFDLHRRLGLFLEAEGAYRKAIEIDPAHSRSWNEVGNLLQVHLARFAEAGAAYRKSIESDQRNSNPWNGLGNLLHSHLGRYDAAESAYRKAIEIDPRMRESWNALGNLLRDHLGRYAEAEKAYREAIEIDARHTHAWNGLGNLYCDYLGRYADAASAYLEAVKIDPKDEIAHQNLAFLYRDFLCSPQFARDAFEAVKTSPNRLGNDTLHLQEALFAAYDSNWGLSREGLVKAIEMIDDRFPNNTTDDWFRASAVLLHLNYGEELLTFLRERGDDARLRPWYEALSSLHQRDRRYLQNIPVEMRTTAEFYFDQIEKRLNALPEKTRRRPMPKPPKKRQAK